jgi:histidine phosphotransfer protein HptB
MAGLRVIEDHILDRTKLATVRQELGAHFARILGYFAEDGIKSIAAIEDAVRIRDAAALVRPAHTLKGESLQFGAEPLGLTAERIERAARAAVEARSFPRGIEIEVESLRPLFEESLTALRRETAPVVGAAALRRPGGFGRKVG